MVVLLKPMAICQQKSTKVNWR